MTVKDAIQAAKRYQAKIDTLSALVEGRSMKAQDVAYAQEQLGDIKDSLAKEIKAGKKADLDNEPQAVRDYYGMLDSVSAFLNVARNSHPIKSKWHSTLAYVRMDIDHFLFSWKEKGEEG